MSSLTLKLWGFLSEEPSKVWNGTSEASCFKALSPSLVTHKLSPTLSCLTGINSRAKNVSALGVPK